jgi:uridine kinase
MDNYEQMTRKPIEEVARWMDDGAPFDRVPMPGLDEHLAHLKAGRAVIDPATGLTLQPARCIVFETQFGRAHAATGRHIDLLVWLDTPADVALARTLRKHTSAARREGDAGGLVEWIDGYLASYLALVERMVRLQRERVLAGADRVVDGMRDPGVLARELALEVAQRMPRDA